MILWIEQVLRSVLATPPGFEYFHLAARLFDSHARFEPPDEIKKMAAPAARIGRVELKRNPHVRRFVAAGREDEALRHHADDSGRNRVDPDSLSHDVGPPSEGSSPKAMRNDYGPRTVRFLLFRREIAPKRRRRAERVDQTACDAVRGDADWIAGPRQVHAARRPGAD